MCILLFITLHLWGSYLPETDSGDTLASHPLKQSRNGSSEVVSTVHSHKDKEEQTTAKNLFPSLMFLELNLKQIPRGSCHWADSDPVGPE